MSKDETMKEIAETLASINDNLEGINAELEDICMSSKMLIFFKMIELKPEMKEKLGPLIDDLAESMDMDIVEQPEKE
ncbi:MAG: hypothetical protein PHQ34_12075 [Methanothrix sp.]|nr:hypothetical protein [Methanothrix sp.]